MGCHRTVARRLLAVALSLGGGTHAEKKDKREKGMYGQISVVFDWLDALKWTRKKRIENILIYGPSKKFL